MFESKRAGKLNPYIQGSVWSWEQDNSSSVTNKTGVQSSGRPVLIISNNTFNQWSSSVNCLTITSVLKDSPVHVLITLDVDSHIQCEQIHTISKNELTEYRGVIPAITLSTVKEKLKIQYDMNTDKSLEMLTEIKSCIDELNDRAADGFGSQAMISEVSRLLVNTHNCFEYIKTELAKMRGAEQVIHSDNTEHTEVPVDDDVPVYSVGTKRRTYTDEDINLIIDETNSIDKIMRIYGFKDKAAAYRTRTYLRKKNKGQTTDIDGKTDIHSGKKRRVYTDEDKQYIIDDANSLSEIMERFSYKDKATAYKMRSYFKKRLPSADQTQANEGGAVSPDSK